MTNHSRVSMARQQGVILLIALIALVAMTLAAIGLVRSIDAGTMVAGNIGFRQSAVATSDAGVETARAWLVAQQMAGGGNLLNDIPASGYYSTRQDSLDITGNRTAGGTDGVDWGGSDPSQPTKAFDAGTDTTGNHMYYLIHRLCATTGAWGATNDCNVAVNQGQGSTQGTIDPRHDPFSGVPSYVYRITVRVNSAKNTVSYAQALVLE
jgi:hypothetical protein